MNINTTVDTIIAAGAPWSGFVSNGQYLTIIDIEGQQGVDFLCYNAHRPEERYHAPNTSRWLLQCAQQRVAIRRYKLSGLPGEFFIRTSRTWNGSSGYRPQYQFFL